MPHFVYGPSEEALQLTVEYGATTDTEMPKHMLDVKDKKSLCRVNGR